MRKSSSRSFSQVQTGTALAGERGSVGNQSQNISSKHVERKRKQKFDLQLAKEVAAIESIISQKKGNPTTSGVGVIAGKGTTHVEAFSDGPSFREHQH